MVHVRCVCGVPTSLLEATIQCMYVFMYVCMYIHTCCVLTNPPIPSSRCKYFVVLCPAYLCMCVYECMYMHACVLSLSLSLLSPLGIIILVRRQCLISMVTALIPSWPLSSGLGMGALKKNSSSPDEKRTWGFSCLLRTYRELRTCYRSHRLGSLENNSTHRAM